MSGGLGRFGALVRLQLRALAQERGAWWVAVTAGVVVLGAGGLRAFALGGDEARFLGSVARSVLTASGAVLAAGAAPALLRGGSAPGWPELLAARGVARPAWLAASLAALLLALAWLAAAVGLATGVVAARLGHDGWAAGWSLVRSGAGPLTVVAAAACACAAVFRRPLPAAAATLALAAAGHLAPALAWAAERADGFAVGLWAAVDVVVPDLAAAPGAAVDAARGLHAVWFAAVAAWVHACREDD